MTNQTGCPNVIFRKTVTSKFLLLLLILILFSGCSGDQTTILTQMAEPTNVRTIQPKITNSSGVITISPTSALNYIAPTGTPTQAAITPSCPQLKEGNTITETITGTVAVQGTDGNFYLISGSLTQPEIVLPGIPCCTFMVGEGTSPFQSLYFSLKHYEENKITGIWEHDLYLISATGSNSIIIPWNEDEWGNSFYGWFDKDRLIIVPKDAPRGSMLLLNPFTNVSELITTSYPDIFDPDFDRSRWPRSEAIYDPTLSRVVILSGPPNSIVLVDLQTNRELWRYTDPLSVNAPPQWLPDGSGFVVMKPVHDNPGYALITYVSKDGEERTIIDTELYTGESLGSFDLSPSGEYISLFWQDQPYGEVSYLKIVNVENGELFNTCLNLDWTAPDSYLWSPDSKQIIALTQEHTYIINITDGTIFRFGNIGRLLTAWISDEH